MLRQAVAPSFPALVNSQTNALSVDDAHQLSRILAQLGVFEKSDNLRGSQEAPHATTRETNQGPLARARAIYNTRQLRNRFFPEMMFGEPGWEILLVLYIHDGVARLCIRDVGRLINTPATTLLRWLKVLEDENLLQVQKSHLDRRVTVLDLTELGRSRFEAFLASSSD